MHFHIIININNEELHEPHFVLTKIFGTVSPKIHTHKIKKKC